MYTYNVYQLRLQSELKLEELFLSPVSNEYDVSIYFKTAHPLKTPVNQGLYYQTQPEVCYLEVPNIVRFLIRHGREILIDPLRHADENSIRLFLYSIAFPRLLIQRNYFLLQGAAIQIHGQNMAFLTHFGQGKSTLLAAFLQRQAHFINDDFCVFNAKLELLPGIPYLHLREDTLKKLGQLSAAFKQVRASIPKWIVPVTSMPLFKPITLNSIYVMKPTAQSMFRTNRLLGLQKIQCINQYIYQPNIVKGSGKSLFYFQKSPELAAQTSLTQIERPELTFKLDELVNHIMEVS